MNIFNSEAPTLSTFLALAGEPTVTGPGPSLPAATSRRGEGEWGCQSGVQSIHQTLGGSIVYEGVSEHELERQGKKK